MSIKNTCFITSAVPLILLVITVGAQPVAGTVISVEGEGLTSLQLTGNDLVKMTQHDVRAKDHGGQTRTFSGVALVDILSKLGVKLGAQLRGKNLLNYVVIAGADNYEVVFALPEIDPEFATQTILIAHKVDGEDLPKGDGPFRIIVPNDKKHARWVREVTSIKVLTVKK